MTNNTKRYSLEFKQEAIKLASKIGVPKAASELGVTSKSIHDWIRKFNPDLKTETSKATKSVQELEAENRRLRKENEYLNKINDVLKKSTAIFSSDQIKGSK